MPKARTLDEALDEVDRWSAKMLAEIEHLTPAERDAYFREGANRIAKQMKSLKTGGKPAAKTKRVARLRNRES